MSQNIPYSFKQARMTFFKLSSYPAYTIENGKMVHDKGEAASKLQRQAAELDILIQKIESRVKRGMAVPRAWVRKITGARALVEAAEELHMTFSDWAKHFYLILDFLKEYKT